MKIYLLKAIQNLPISQKEAWTFLSDPKNLKQITPDYMGFKIVSGLSDKIYAGKKVKARICDFSPSFMTTQNTDSVVKISIWEN